VADALRTLTIANVSDFARLGEQWDDLCRDSASDNVFLTWDWIETWWETFGPTKELAVVAAYSGDKLVGIAPLYRSRADAGARRRALLLLGCGDAVSPDYLSFIVRRGCEDAASAALVTQALKQWPASVLDLRDLPEDAPLVGWLQRAGAPGCTWAAGAWSQCPYAALPARWESYETSLSANMRANVRRRTRRMLGELGARLVRWHDGGSAHAGLEELARLHRLRWQGRAQHYGFVRPGYAEFHQRIAERFAARGWLRLYGLEAEGRTIAAWYGYRYGDRFYYYQSGFDPAWGRHSPGMVLQGLAIREAIAEGAKEFDLLKGAHGYKETWADRRRRTVRVMIAAPGARGRMLVAPVWLEERKRQIKAMLPPRLRVWLNGVRANRSCQLCAGEVGGASVLDEASSS
jgi:CelD/BcsL family acetyltransferase involved in cellulose biosynthesis